MAVLSELKSASGEDLRLRSATLDQPPVEPDYVVDEEFPSDLSGYDRMLQTPSGRASDRLLRLAAVAFAALLIVFCLVYMLPKPVPSVVTSPSSTSSSTPVSR